jgi:hypothetical protein
MSVKSFKFVSPGVFINEIDNSFVPRTPTAQGPVIIGRSTRGPAMQPVTVESYSDFVNMFGDTVPGKAGGDIYRDGNYQSPMYGTYAAKAFMRANVAPVTYIRLLGQQTTTNNGSTGRAGWGTTGVPKNSATVGGGSYGLFLFPSGTNPATSFIGDNGGQLAAIWYVQSGSVALQGTVAGGTATTATSACTMIASDANGVFKVVIDGAIQGEKTISFNFDDDTDLFARKRFNTNPQLTSTQGAFYASASHEDYWLGETFEQELRERSLTGGSQIFGVVVGLGSGSAAGGTYAASDRAIGPDRMLNIPSQEAVAGWFVGQDLGTAASFSAPSAQKLFRLIGRGHGEWLQKNIKVSIEKIRQSSNSTSEYGTFSLVLRSLLDTDNSVVVIERFDNLTLDPTSPNYIARKIGTQYQEWNATTRSLKTYGDYPNLSKFVRVEMDSAIADGASGLETLLPFGYFGPPKFRDVAAVNAHSASAATSVITSILALGGNTPGVTRELGRMDISSSYSALATLSCSFNFPEVRLRNSASDGGLSDPTNAYFGMEVTRTATSTTPDKSVADPHRLWYASLGTAAGIPVDPTAASYNTTTSVIEGYSYVFTMDNVRTGSTGGYYYSSGSRKTGQSISAAGTNTYETLLNAGYDRFTAPFWGGFDGFDITKPDPLYNKGITDISTPTEDNSYAYHTFKRAIDTVADPEYINMNLLSVPGLTVDSLTGHAINVCEERADSLAVVDLASVYLPNHEQYESDASSRIGTTPSQAANSLRARRIDSSYGCTFYPWVQTRDEATGQLVWIPPSVAMMGVLASSEKASQLWYAPAGFNRGGLTDGAAGIPITSVTERLVSKDRDLLYEASINPIASFPSTGIVVFGQKTLQERQSALDRINVRRLVIYLKKQISVLSTQVLFDQNVQSTWNRFKSLIEPFLANVKVQYGITDYKLILDESTTTPDLVDQNIMYAKIMIKPARAIEYIAIDFVIASTGASFED